MKRWFTLMALCFIGLSVMAEEEETSVLIFYNDGIIDSYSREEVDSISYVASVSELLGYDILRVHLQDDTPVDYNLTDVDSVVFTPPSGFFSVLTKTEGKKTYLTATLRLLAGGNWDMSDLELGFVFSGEKFDPLRDPNCTYIPCGSRSTAGVLEKVVSNKNDHIIGDKLYHYRAYAKSKETGLTIYGTTKSFKLKPVIIWPGKAAEVKKDVLDSYYYQATVYADIYGDVDEIKSDRDAQIGFYYGTEQFPSRKAGSTRQEGFFNNVSDIEAELHELEPGTRYYYCGFVEIADTIYYGDQQTFETPELLEVVTGDTANVGAASADVYYRVIAKLSDIRHAGGVAGIQYGTTPDLNSLGDDSYYQLTNWEAKSDDTYYAHFFKLNPKTTYYYRAYAVIDGQWTYGEIKSFTTKDITVETFDAKDVTDTTVHLDGELLDKDAINAGDSFGFFINTTGEPVQNNSYMFSGKFGEDSNGTFYLDLTGLTPEITYYYRAFVTYKGVIYMGKVKTFIAQTSADDNICPDDNHPHMIDLGIGVKWACCNVGANAPWEYGDYFAWGETSPKEVYNWSTYKYGSSSFDLTKYCTYSWEGTVDNKMVLEASDDAATVNSGASYRMPTLVEFQTILSNCSSQWTTYHGVNGRKFTGPNGNSIFLPAAGGAEGIYWSSSLGSISSALAYVLYFHSDYKGCVCIYRLNGNPVRAVCVQE